jgi:hypothetical protein
MGRLSAPSDCHRQRAKKFAKALLKAKKLAATQEPRYLPGWSGVIAAKINDAARLPI